MKNLKWAMAALFILSAGSFALTACGDDDTCEVTSDCSSGEVCFDQRRCVTECSQDPSACTSNQQCVEIPGSGKGCVPDETPSDAGPTDGGMDGGDTGPETKSYFVQIKDVTRQENTRDRDGDGTPDGEQSCNAGGSSEGGDLFGVELLDENGNSLAWGEIVVGNRTGEASEGSFDGILDGEAPPLTESADGGVQCPGMDSPTFSGNVVSTGCGGSAVVGFKDDNGEFIAIESGFTVVGYEYGVACFQNCDTSDVENCQVEHISANLCDPTSDPSEQETALLGASSPSAGGDFPQCSGTNLGTSDGVVGQFPVN